MINRRLITKEQALYAIENGEFDNEVLTSANIVVIILTQDWCSQWTGMKSWIYDMQIEDNIDIYELEYNKVDYFRNFMKFKENELGNSLVPYLRYYKGGVLINETNYVSKQEFMSILNI